MREPKPKYGESISEICSQFRADAIVVMIFRPCLFALTAQLHTYSLVLLLLLVYILYHGIHDSIRENVCYIRALHFVDSAQNHAECSRTLVHASVGKYVNIACPECID